MSNQDSDEPSAMEWIPVAAIEIPGEGNPAYFDLSADSGWKMLRDEITEAFVAEASPSGKFFPEQMHGFDLTLTAMTRGQFDRLPEHNGW